jgi:4a-hydroxytetrahydrobiopterin dehydratase
MKRKSEPSPLGRDDIKHQMTQIKGWRVVRNHHLEKTFKFGKFKEALDFVNLVGNLAENVGHHPDIFLSYDHVKIRLWTHSMKGLSIADFTMAAKIDKLK